jgi:SpoVK/Ycf46/Vps4 family AAA+-type ATPase
MHFDDNDERFRTIALQIAAHEAQIGHTEAASEIKSIIQNGKSQSKRSVLKFPGKHEVFEQRISSYRFDDLVLPESMKERIERIVFEYKKRHILRKNGLKNRSRVLITGASGTGKTMTASVLSNEIGIPLFTIPTDKVVTKFMGETSIKLRQIFESIGEIAGVYLFDEFDAIGADRSLDNDVGEMRRILNTFLTFLENDDSDSIIVAATNNPKLLDRALFRRFDDVLEYELPSETEIRELYYHRFNGFRPNFSFDDHVIRETLGLSQADIVSICDEAIKSTILNDSDITEDELLTYIADRKNICKIRESVS